MLGSAWRSARSCTGVFSRRTDPKPLLLRPPTRRQNSWRNSDVSKCRPFSDGITQISSSPVTSCSAWTCLEKTWICVKITSPLRRLTQNLPGRRAMFPNVVLSLTASRRYRPHPSQVALPDRAWRKHGSAWRSRLLSDDKPKTCPAEERRFQMSSFLWRHHADIVLTRHKLLCLNVLVKIWICVKITKSPRRRLTRNVAGRRATFLNVVLSLSTLLRYRPHPSQPDNKNAAFWILNINVSFCLQHSTKMFTTELN
jgi:hypothetical protein